MAGDTTIFDLAEALLTAVADRYASIGIALPDKQYVSNGTEAFDCECLTARCLRTYPISGANLSRADRMLINGFNRREGEFSISLIRCVPTIEGDPVRFPSESEIEASARELLTDAEELPLSVIAAYQAGDLPGCGGVTFLGWAAYGPEGGFGGGTATLGLVLD